MRLREVWRLPTRKGRLTVKIGFIGLGNMATAIIGGLLRESTVLADGAAVTAADLIGSAKTEATRQAKATQFGIAVT